MLCNLITVVVRTEGTSGPFRRPLKLLWENHKGFKMPGKQLAVVWPLQIPNFQLCGLRWATGGQIIMQGSNIC